MSGAGVNAIIGTAMSGAMHFWREESGADMIEYVLIATLIALAAIAGIGTVGNKIGAYYNSITASM